MEKIVYQTIIALILAHIIKANTTLNTLLAGYNLNSRIHSDSRFCISGWSNNDNICEDLINNGQAPYLCDGSNSMCNYTSSITKKTVSQYSCNCDLITRQAHCPIGSDTTEYLNYIEAKLNVLFYQCHYSNKWECYLVTQSSRYNLLNSSFLWSEFTLLNSDYASYYYPRICIKSIYKLYKNFLQVEFIS